MNEIVNNNLLTIYPNPSTGIFQLATGYWLLTDLKIQVYNAIGEMVLSETVNQNKSTIDLSDKSNGVYFIKVNSGETVLTEKVLLSR